MKKILISVLFLFVTLVSYSQIKVLSIEPDEADLTARINPKQDRNGFNCAMLRITTMGVNGEQRRKFRFSGDMATQIVDVSFPEGEIWVYLSPGRSSLIIVHDDYGREIYDMPYELKEKTCYRMVITVDKEDIVKNYLIIKADQPNALIYVDDVFMGEKEVAQLYSAGDMHKWRIECDMYHSESGEAKISYTGNTVVEKTLRPAFGYFNLTTKPETGATVYVDGKKTGETPYFMDKMKSGEYKVKVMKEMYYPEERSFVVRDGDTTNMVIEMRGNYANVTVETDAGADIYVDNEYKGKGRWSGRMIVGEHLFEAKKELHRTTQQNVTLTAGMDKNIQIPNPEPVYGKLNVTTTPLGAKIYIDGKMVGSTPKYITDVMIGSHELVLEKSGYVTVKKTLMLEEEKEVSVNEKMRSVGGEISSGDDKTRVEEKEEYVQTESENTEVLSDNTDKKQDKPVDVEKRKTDKVFDFGCGPVVGVQMTSMADKIANIEWKTSITFGLFTRFAIKNFVVQPEVTYNNSVFGFVSKDSEPKGSVSRTYLYIPLLLGYQTKGESFKMRFAAGPSYQLLIGRKIVFEGNTDTDVFKNGMGITFNVGADLKRLVIDVKYDIGLTHFYKEQGTYDVLGYYKGGEFVCLSNLKQNVLSLTIGFRLF
ncbi:MAG TPA: PEGA domain-containing protein [Bacteroidetes bacterium]|nr:PEGA domain-containing protein [Candidatus Limimorpha avicola]